jgi:hypothetical protein
MNIGICGSHRVGKTTLAERLAQHKGVPFLPTKVGEIFAELHLDVNDDLTFIERLSVQRTILERCSLMWDSEQSGFVTDRTPIDFISYLLLSIDAHTTTENDLLVDYITECYSVVNSTFTQIIYMQPAIHTHITEGKGSINAPFMEHLNVIVRGILNAEYNYVPFIEIPKKESYTAFEYVKNNLLG